MNFISLYLEGKNVSVCTLIKNFFEAGSYIWAAVSLPNHPHIIATSGSFTSCTSQ